MLSALIVKLSFLLPITVHDTAVETSQQTVWIEEEAGRPIESPEAALELLSSDRHQGPAKAGLNFGFRPNAVWLLTRVRNESKEPELAFVLKSVFLDEVKLWMISEQGLVAYPPQGDEQLIENSYAPSRSPNYRLPLAQGQEAFVLYRIQSTSALLGNAEVATIQAFTSNLIVDHTLLSLCWGVMIVMILYHLFLWWSMRHSIYLWYSAYILMNLISQTALQGQFYQIAGQISPYITRATNVYSALTLILLLTYTSQFLSLKRYSLGAQRYLQGLTLAVLAIMLIIPTAGWVTYNKISNMSTFFTSVSILVVALIALKNGQKAARFYIFAFTVLLASVAVFVLKNLGVVPPYTLLNFALPFGSALQVTLMSLALGDRMRMIEEAAKERDRQHALEEAKHKAEVIELNASLERKVAEQTRDIRGMLEYTKIGLFSVTEDLSVHKDYARHLETILEDKNVAGEPFLEVLLAKAHIGPDSKQRIMTAIEYSMGEDEMFFEANAGCFPNEMPIKIANREKSIDIDWSPILNDDGKVEKILISLRDVTEMNRLRKEAEEGRRNLRYLGEIIHVGPTRYERFSKAMDEAWKQVQSFLDHGKGSQTLPQEDIRRVYIQFHTIKGGARAFGLSELSDAIHVAEDLVMGKTQLEGKGYTQLVEAFERVLASYANYQKAAAPILALRHQLDEKENPSDGWTLKRLFRDTPEALDTLAKELGKGGCQFRWDCGDDLFLGEAFYTALEKSLVHLVRNSVDHGLEKPEVRRAKGKAEVGTLRAYWDPQGRLALGDDGAGLNLARLKAKAEELGRKVQGTQDLIAMIFESGISTKEAVDQISGRGVGMDAVRLFLQENGSNIEVVPIETEGDYLRFYFAITIPESVRKTWKKAS